MALAPEVDEWRLELEARWARPVALSGSGPSLFAFFVDLDEAREPSATSRPALAVSKRWSRSPSVGSHSRRS